MPFQSKAQQGYLYANHPDVAEDFAAHTSKKQYKKLPYKKKVSKMADPFGISKATYSESMNTIRGHRKKAATQAHVGNVAAGVGTGTVIGAVAFPELAAKIPTARLGRRLEAKGTAGNIVHGLSGAPKKAKTFRTVARAGKALQHPAAGLATAATLGTAAIGTGVGYRVASFKNQNKANATARSFNQSTKGVARIKQNPLSRNPKQIYKSAFGVDHVVSKTVLLPKPFKGGKKMLKPIKPAKPGANSKTDNTSAGGTL